MSMNHQQVFTKWFPTPIDIKAPNVLTIWFGIQITLYKAFDHHIALNLVYFGKVFMILLYINYNLHSIGTSTTSRPNPW